VDFIVPHGRERIDAIECKWDPAALRCFRRDYPGGRNLLVTPSSVPAHARRFGDLEVSVCGLPGLA
jgi:hypothetical protein